MALFTFGSVEEQLRTMAENKCVHVELSHNTDLLVGLNLEINECVTIDAGAIFPFGLDVSLTPGQARALAQALSGVAELGVRLMDE